MFVCRCVVKMCDSMPCQLRYNNEKIGGFHCNFDDRIRPDSRQDKYFLHTILVYAQWLGNDMSVTMGVSFKKFAFSFQDN